MRVERKGVLKLVAWRRVERTAIVKESGKECFARALFLVNRDKTHSYSIVEREVVYM